MPSYIEGLGCNVGLTQEDFKEFAAAQTPPISLKDWIRGKMVPNIPPHQDFKPILVGDLDNLDLSDLDLSGLAVVGRTITNVNFERTNLKAAFFSNVTFDPTTKFTNAVMDDATMLVHGTPRLDRGRVERALSFIVSTESSNHGSALTPEQLEQIRRSKAVYKLLSERSAAEVNIRDFSRSALSAISRIFIRSFRPTYDVRKDILLLDNAALLCRYALAKGDITARPKLDAIGKIYEDQANAIIKDKLNELVHEDSIHEELHGAIFDHITTTLATNGCFTDHFLIQHSKDLESLVKSVTAEVESFISAGVETTDAFNISANKGNIRRIINEWKDKIVSKSITRHLPGLSVTRAPASIVPVVSQSDRRWSPSAPSSWPTPAPGSAEAAEALKLKKEALQLILNCMAVIGAADATRAAKDAATDFLTANGITNEVQRSLGLVPSVTGMAGGVGAAVGAGLIGAVGGAIAGPVGAAIGTNLGAAAGRATAIAGVATAGYYAYAAINTRINQITEDSHLVRGQLGDRLLELGAQARYAINPHVPVIGVSIATLLTNIPLVTQALGMVGAPNAFGVSLGLSLTALVSDWRAINRTLGRETAKTNFMERLSPAYPKFKEMIAKKMFWTRIRRNALIGTALTVGIIGSAFGITALAVGLAPAVTFFSGIGIVTVGVVFVASTYTVSVIDKSLRRRRRIRDAAATEALSARSTTPATGRAVARPEPTALATTPTRPVAAPAPALERPEIDTPTPSHRARVRRSPSPTATHVERVGAPTPPAATHAEATPRKGRKPAAEPRKRPTRSKHKGDTTAPEFPTMGA